MNAETLSSILPLLIIAVLVYMIIKVGIKIAVCFIVILIVFKVGFMMTGTELNETFKLDQYLKPEASEKVINFFDEFREKGNELAVVDQDAVYEGIADTMKTTINTTATVLTSIDYQAIANNIIKAIQDSGIQITEEELKDSLQNNIPTITEEELNKMTNEILSSIK